MQASEMVVSGAGWLGMVRGDRPASLTATSSFDQLVVGIPAELVIPRIAGPAAVGTTGTMAGLLGVTVAYLFAHAAEFDRDAARRAGERVADLTVACFASAGRPGPRALLLQSAMDEAERRLRDPELGAESLARHVHVSRRTLEKLFADRGTSVSRWIRERRLERSRSELRAAGSARLSVEEIALRWGFVDRTHFSRVYRERFGVPPGADRRAAGTALSPAC
jgi:AraC-like DNA-binding protein